MHSKNIIVTGGAGFLGTHLCRALAQAGHMVTVIDLKENPEFPTHLADVRDQALMEEYIPAGTDLVFHLASLIEAGESVKNPATFIDQNINGTLSVLNAMKKNEVKNFVFSSSAAVYGEPLHVPIKEDDRTMPINPYGMTKLAMEALLSSYVASFGFTGVALRYFNLYGPEEHHQPETHAMPRFIKQIYDDQEVTVWGDGHHQRDYIHVQDIVTAHVNAIALCDQQPNQYHYFNLSTEKASSVLDIVAIIEKAMNKKAQIKHFESRPGDPDILVADASKAHEQLQWRATIDLESGVTETVNYFLNHWENTP